jgi:hypothetical protein
MYILRPKSPIFSPFFGEGVLKIATPAPVPLFGRSDQFKIKCKSQRASRPGQKNTKPSINARCGFVVLSPLRTMQIKGPVLPDFSWCMLPKQEKN